MTEFVIITRTWNRPLFIKDCIKSIRQQEYSGQITHIIIDETQENHYVRNWSKDNYRRIVYRVKHKPKNMKFRRYIDGVLHLHAPWNQNMTTALIHVRTLAKRRVINPDAIIVYLDDDDIFIDNLTLQKLHDTKRSKSQIWLWRARFQNGVLYPNDEHWCKPPTTGQLSTIGFAHSLALSKFASWGKITRGDYRTAYNIFYQAYDVEWIDEALAAVNRTNAMPMGKGDDKC